MFRVIYPNRPLIWILVAITVSDFLVWASIEQFSLEQDILINQGLVLSLQKAKRTSWKTHVVKKETFSYSLKYPGHYSVFAKEDENKTCFRKSTDQNGLEFCVSVLPNPKNLDLVSWWEKNKGDRTSEKQEEIKIAKTTGLLLSRVQESFSNSYVVLSEGSNIILLEGNLPSGTLQSFSILK